MSRPRVYALLLLLAFAALPAAGAPRPPDANNVRATPLDPEFMGLAIRDPWYEFNTNPSFPNAPNQAFQDAMGATLELAGARWVRLEFHIPVGITSTEAISAEIGKNDYFINQVAPRHGLKVLGLLSFDLLRGTEATLLNSPITVASHYGGGVNQYMDTWLTRALMIADHYRDNIAAYEILNEQNRLPPDGKAIAPDIMGRLLAKFYRFCHGIEVPQDEPSHGCASARIILGGLHPRGTSIPSFMSDVDYLKAIYTDPNSFVNFRTNPGHPYYPVDGIAYHPYPEEIQPSLADIRINTRLPLVRQALTDVGDPCTQLWITEVGYNVDFDPDGPKKPGPAQTEQEQADFMRDVYTSLAQRRLDPQLCGIDQAEVANVFWFKYEDFPPAEIIKDSKGNIVYPQKWGIVRIPILSDGGCEGGCYEPSGVPLLYRQSFWAYRELAGKLVYRAYLPTIGQQPGG
ncbi:MAG: hypothetical protein ACJ8CR_19255 [Roseiflexaceae bacterium]